MTIIADREALLIAAVLLIIALNTAANGTQRAGALLIALGALLHFPVMVMVAAFITLIAHGRPDGGDSGGTPRNA